MITSFRLHPWLPSAMEGPTPVSALLHRSTMVVAGVFLLVRCAPLLESSSWALRVIAILGSLTALFAARAALGQYDIKKIVAYSTTSQLGLMVVAVGLGLPWLALFHICTHAFFKALLFLCSGSAIHSLNKEQDLRKMGAVGITLPVTRRAITVARLALCGVPFLAGYYSKDIILEARQYNISKRISLVLAIIATFMTAGYSARIVYYLVIRDSTSNSISPIREENRKLTSPLLRLLLGVSVAGWSFSLTTFHGVPLVIPFINKRLPILVTLIAALYVLFLRQIFYFKNLKLFSFIRKKWFFVQLSHRSILLTTIKKRIKGVLRSLDQGCTISLGPKGISEITPLKSRLMLKRQTGSLSGYILYFILLSSLLITFILFF